MNGSSLLVAGTSIGASFYSANTATTLAGNADMTSSAALAAASTTVTSLRFNASSSLTLDLGAHTLITGGILIGTGTGANNELISNGTLEGINTQEPDDLSGQRHQHAGTSAVIANNTGATG